MTGALGVMAQVLLYQIFDVRRTLLSARSDLFFFLGGVVAKGSVRGFVRQGTRDVVKASVADIADIDWGTLGATSLVT